MHCKYHMNVMTKQLTYIRRHHPILRWHSHWRAHWHGPSRRGARTRPWRLAGNFHWTWGLGAILLCFCLALGRRPCWWWWWIWLVLLLLHGATSTSFSPTRDIYKYEQIYVQMFKQNSLTFYTNTCIHAGIGKTYFVVANLALVHTEYLFLLLLSCHLFLCLPPLILVLEIPPAQ